MKKITCIVLFLSLHIFCYSQNLDLIITTEKDSIACKILKVNDSDIIFMVKSLGHKNVKSVLDREKIIEFKYDVIQEEMYFFKPGTSYIIGKAYHISPGTSYPVTSKTYSLESLQNASDEELGYYHYKALKLQKTGKTLNIVGGSILGATVVSSAIFADQLELGVVILWLFGGITGLGTMAVGIPMNVTGKKRVERISTIKNMAFNDITIGLKPCAQYNMTTQNYQPGIAVKIRF